MNYRHRLTFILAAFTILLVTNITGQLSGKALASVSSPSGSDVCFATYNNGVTEFSSFDSQPVQDAIEAAPAGATVKVAGVCGYTLDKVIAGGTIKQTIYISKSVTIQGGYHPADWAVSDSDLNETKLDANAMGRVIVLHNPTGGAPIDVKIDSLTIENGDSVDTVITGGNDGAGVLVANNVNATLSNVIVSGNGKLDSDASGGGVWIADGATLDILDSQFLMNKAEIDGGAIYNSGILTVKRSTFTDNVVVDDAGAIYNNDGTVTIDQSTFTRNVARGLSHSNGGAISNVNGPVTVRNSTFESNEAQGNGGAIASFFTGANVQIENSTFSGNVADTSGGAAYRFSDMMTFSHTTIVRNSSPIGAGVASRNVAGDVGLRANIIASNTGEGDDIEMTTSGNQFVSEGFNLIGTLGGTIALGATDITDAPAPVAATLDANGGPTETLALVGSAAVNKVTDNICPASDQRGFFRSDSSCDIGSFEISDGPCAARDSVEREYYSIDASAVMSAVVKSSRNGTVQVAGTCAGVQAVGISGGTISQTVFISEPINFEGGHTPSNWDAAPDSVLYPTVLDAEGGGRVLVALRESNDDAGFDVTISNLIMQHGSAGSNVNVEPFNRRGGAIFVGAHVDLTVGGSSILSSEGQFGGGILVMKQGAATISDSRVDGNSAEIQGGGIYNEGVVRIIESDLSNNSAATATGGGIYNDGLSTLRRSTLTGNSASFGGGIYNNDTIDVNDSTIVGNSSSNGGGGINNSGALIVSNSTISENVSIAGAGGGIYSDGTAEVRSSAFLENSADSGGGVFSDGTSTFVNTTFANNQSISSGGGIHNGLSGTTTITNSTFSGNSSPASKGGGIFNTGNLIVANSIIANSPTGGNCINSNATISTSHTLFSSSGANACDQTAANGNLLNFNPLLEPLTTDPGIPAYFPLQTELIVLPPNPPHPASPAINTGEAASCSHIDQRGYLRIDSMCDMGAYEDVTSVARCATEVNGVERQSLDASALREAVAFATSGEIVKVAGTCQGVEPALVGGGTFSQTLVINKSLVLQGGHRPTDWDEVPNNSLYPTTLDAQEGGRVIQIHNSASPGSSGLEILLSQLTLQNGKSDQFGFGGGIRIVQGGDINLVIEQSLLLANQSLAGGALKTQGNSSVEIHDSSLSGNWGLFGGGIENSGTITISESTISNNRSSVNGGAINNNFSGTVNVYRSTLNQNQSYHGGGIWSSGTVSITNSTISGNNAAYGGGLLNKDPFDRGGSIAAISIDSSTIVSNSALIEGGGFFNTGTIAVQNSIVANGSASDCNNNSAIDFSSSLIEDNSCGLVDGVDGNIVGLAPMTDALADNGGPTKTHALRAGSPAIARGHKDSCLTIDQRGELRSSCDMGAYERPTPCTVDMMAGYTVQLNHAIGCYNSQASGTYSITFSADITLTEPSIPISNTGSADLIITGQESYALDGNLMHRGLTVNAGTLTVEGLTIRNGAAREGGAIFNPESGTVTVRNSSLVNNSAEIVGGGIANRSNGTVTVHNSTLSGNSTVLSVGSGAGIHNIGTLTVTNSTLSANQTAGWGGGIWNARNALATISNSTLAGNSAERGGAIMTDGSLTVRNSIMANSPDANECEIYTNGTASISYSLIENGGCDASTGTSNLIDDPMLAPLLDYGGSTFTHGLLTGSPAIGAAEQIICDSQPIAGKDQRGATRDNDCDMGSHEGIVTVPTAVKLQSTETVSTGSAAWSLLLLLLATSSILILRRKS